MSDKSSQPSWLATAIHALQAGNVDGWMEMYEQDAIHEFPFASDGAPRELRGRPAIAAYMQQLPKRFRFGTLSDVRVHEGDEEPSLKRQVIIRFSKMMRRGISITFGLSSIATARLLISGIT